jgi:hypothetical protein
MPAQRLLPVPLVIALLVAAPLLGFALHHFFPKDRDGDRDRVFVTLISSGPLLVLPASDDPQLAEAVRELRYAKGIELLRLHRTADTPTRSRIREHLRQAVEKGWFSAADKPLFEHGRHCLQAEPDGSLEHCLHRAGVAVPEWLRDTAHTS